MQCKMGTAPLRARHISQGQRDLRDRALLSVAILYWKPRSISHERARGDGHRLNAARPIHSNSCLPACTNPFATVLNGVPCANADPIAYDDRSENRSSFAIA